MWLASDTLHLKLVLEKNIKEAIAILEILTLQAQSGHLESQFALGRVYYDGTLCISPDRLKAIKWLQEAEKNGMQEDFELFGGQQV